MKNSTLIWKIIIHLFIWNSSLGDHVPDHPLRNRLKTWETISEDDIFIHRERRDTKIPTLDKKISVKVFDRKLTLSLISSPEIFAPSFTASVLGRNGGQRVSLDKRTLYRGTVVGEPGSDVQVHLEDKDLMASIKTKQETYIIEPSWRHLPEDSPEQHRIKSKMIVYRQSDLNLSKLGHPHQPDGYCGVESIMKDLNSQRKNSTKSEEEEKILHKEKKVSRSERDLHRAKRAAGGSGKICTLALVADHRFYREMGNNDHLQAMYYLINLIDRVNQIFKTTDWDVDQKSDEYTGYGFQIGDIKVYNESTYDPSFNAPGPWTAEELLQAFSETDHGHCLAHLFTYVDFANGVLGLAYVGASKEEDVGGICTKPYIRGQGKKPSYLNTGLTTTVNWKTRILTLEADLVTTHELGHNFGAEHDDGEIRECSPGESHDGNYVMYPAAVSGADSNNKKFSVCSKHNVFRCLVSKAPICFKEHKKLFCGNYKVEEGEECDAGYLSGVGEDACCTRDCKLKPHAKCSNKNSVCCNEYCQVASSDTLCYSGVPESCLRNTNCDGKSFECPAHLTKKDDDPCGDNGKCKTGQCQPFCVTVGMKPCLCADEKENFCLRCCAPADSFGQDMIEQCKPYLNNSIPLSLRDNARCILGYCSDGECIKQTQDVIERVWSIFEHIAPDKIGEFLADNIVGAVLVFSLLFWVPCGCLVNFVDKKREKQRKKEEQWFTEKGSDFSRPNAYGGMFGSSTALHKINKNNRGGAMAMRAGLNAKDQWRQSQERGLVARRKSQEKLADQGNGQTSSRSHFEPLGRGGGVVVNVGQTNNSAQVHPVKNDITSNTQKLVPVIRDAKGGDGYPSSSRKLSMGRPQLQRQVCAIEEEPDDDLTA